METAKYMVYFGSYAAKEAPGIYIYEFDERSGELTFVDSVSDVKDPSFLKPSLRHGTLYAFSQSAGEPEKSAAVAYRIDTATGRLAYMGQQPTADKSSTHINTDQAGQYLMLVSYGGGTLSLLPLGEDGSIGELSDQVHHEGRSIMPARQESAHPHSIYTDPSDQFVVVPDLGMDKIVVYRLDRERHKLQPHDEVRLAPGSGPRHMTFHPTLPYAYVIQELSSTLTVLSYDRQAGKLEPIQIINTLPEAYDGPANSCAEVQISPCGAYLYGSNRGHDSIVVCSIDQENGMLSVVEHTSTLGSHPRHFSLSPSGRYLFAANKDSDSVQLFQVDKESGRLTSTGQHIAISQPTCVRFYPLGFQP
ncbi:lactonase family protein [Paenibacillus piri]|uniref:Lactonase family protein n=1 Tax=Paenibacillus piri TaxID=2547395 RepID=A0A4R5KS00_9BACL|nr:lactonase family protein [Paenibacillus piri]TDF98609.1 lactonase family protein [Paenibacillus piri]